MARRRAALWAQIVLAAYAVALAAIALWPTPVDGGARPLLRAITEALPWLTYSRIEFGANIALFVPLGLLLVLTLARSRYLVLPVAVVTSVAIEMVQAFALDQRTASLLDIVANVTGACIGMFLGALIDRAAVRDPHGVDVVAGR